MRKGLSAEQKIELALADNRTAELAEWDPLVLEELNLEVPDVLAGMFSPVELDDIFSLNDSNGPVDGEDDVPEAPEEPVTQLGDLYQLGEHRLLCGDSTTQDQVNRLMDGQKADMVFTSPPYNANTKMPDGDVFGNKSPKETYISYKDELTKEEYLAFVENVLNICFSITDGRIFWNVNYNAHSRFEYIAQIYKKLPFLIEQIAWLKSSAIPFKGSMQRRWEPIYIFSTDKKPLGLDLVTSNVWEVNNTNSQHSHHKACFPVALPEKAIRLMTDARVVYDPFGGSGSTLIACEKLKRKCYMMEIDPAYCDVIVKRWEEFTEKKAELT